MDNEINLQREAETIAERGNFQSVLILVTGSKSTDNQQILLGQGMVGNLYANHGAARSFVLTQDAYTDQYARSLKDL